MAFREISPIDIAYKNKVFGNLVDPYEWNNNFIAIENNIDANAEQLNINFETLASVDGAKEIGIEDLAGDTETDSTVYAQIALIVNRLVASYTKAEIDNILGANASETVANIQFDASNGQFLITFLDSTPENPHTTILDTNIEKIPISVGFVEDGGVIKIRITNYDGTYTEADASRLVDVYTGGETPTISTTVVNGVITSGIKAGSITSEHLALDLITQLEGYVTSAQGYALNAQGYASDSQGYATNSANSATLSQSYAVGGTSSRSGEATDNSKYYSQVASGHADDASRFANNAQGYANDANGYANDAGNSATSAAGSASSADGYATNASNQALVSEGWAKGTQNGTEVTSESPYYHNNSKWYKDQAESIVGPSQSKITAIGILKGEGDGVVSAAVAGTDYQAPLDFTSTPSSANKVVTESELPTIPSSSAMLRGDGNGGITSAVAGTDYQLPLTAGTDYQTPLDFMSAPSSSNKVATANDLPTVPTALSDLTDDSTHRTVTDTEKSAWSGKQDALSFMSTPSSSNKVATASDLPTVPTALSQLSDDATHRLVTDTEKSTWSGKQDALTFTSTPSSNNKVVTENDLPSMPEGTIYSDTAPIDGTTSADEEGQLYVHQKSVNNLDFYTCTNATAKTWFKMWSIKPLVKTEIIETSRTWTAPECIEQSFSVTVVGGGGGRSLTGSSNSANGGGAGASLQKSVVTIPKGQSVVVTIGAGGTTGNGGTSSFGNYLSAYGGTASTTYSGASARSTDGMGGGGGAYNGGGDGGYYGGGGGGGYSNPGGGGDGGYYGGGGGGGAYNGTPYAGGAGGAGGGGNGGAGGAAGSNGTNTVGMGLDFEGTGTAGTYSSAVGGGGGGGGYGGNGGNGIYQSKAGYGGGGGGYGGTGGNGLYYSGGGGGGYGGKGGNGSANSIYDGGGGGGGYGSTNYGHGLGGEFSTAGNGVVIVSYQLTQIELNEVTA